MPRTVPESIAGAILSISASLPATYDSTGYAAVGMVYTPVGEVESWGNHGVKAQISQFTPVDTAQVNKVKGSKDYGSMALVIGSVPGDAGQAVLNTASESNAHYSVKLTYPDGDVHYLDVIVSSFEFQDGTVNNIQKVGCELAICRKPVVVNAP